MVISAHFEPLDIDSETPRPHRRRLQLEVSGALSSGTPAAVLIHNVSATGLLLETETPLGEGERIEIDLPELGPTAATIVWSDATFHGGHFDNPISAGVLSALELRSAAAPLPLNQPRESLATRLHHLRKSKGMTLEAVARELGVSKPTVWAWEQGRARPSPERFARIAELFGLGESRLATGRDVDALGEVLTQARQLVANSLGIELTKVRIMIEL
ncbi:MAG: helix-turn-helix domain-containing protein [Novosphingobium sp.]